MEGSNNQLLSSESTKIKQKSSKTTLALLLASILLNIIFLGLILLLISSVFNQNDRNSVIPTTTNVTSISTPTIEPSNALQPIDFVGKYVNAKLPTNWEIIESSDFTDAEVSGYDVNKDYKGLSFLKILYKNSPIIQFSAMNGTGDDGTCQTMSRFKDTSIEYIQNKTNANSNFSQPAPTVLDLTQSIYSEYPLLGRIVRRVGTQIYFRDNLTNENFNPSCGFPDMANDFNELGFSSIDNRFEYHLYKIERNIPSTFTQDDLTQLDQVLQSIKGN